MSTNDERGPTGPTVVGGSTEQQITSEGCEHRWAMAQEYNVRKDDRVEHRGQKYCLRCPATADVLVRLVFTGSRIKI